MFVVLSQFLFHISSMISQLCHIFLFDFTSHISCKQDMPYDVWVSTLFFPIFHCFDFTNFIWELNSPKISHRQFNIQCPGLKCLGFWWPVNRRQNSAHHWRDTRQSTFLDFQRCLTFPLFFWKCQCQSYYLQRLLLLLPSPNVLMLIGADFSQCQCHPLCRNAA